MYQFLKENFKIETCIKNPSKYVAAQLTSTESVTSHLFSSMNQRRGSIFLPGIELGSFPDQKTENVILSSSCSHHHQSHPTGVLRQTGKHFILPICVWYHVLLLKSNLLSCLLILQSPLLSHVKLPTPEHGSTSKAWSFFFVLLWSTAACSPKKVLTCSPTQLFTAKISVQPFVALLLTPPPAVSPNTSPSPICS